MSEPFQYTIRYTLDKAYLNECFEQSAIAKSFLSLYQKSFIFIVIGIMLLMFTVLNRYLASFFIALGVIEALSVRFHQPWWVTRQLFGRSGNSVVELNIDALGFAIHSPYVKSYYQWHEIQQIDATSKGYLLTIANKKQYISASILSEEAITFMLDRAKKV